MTAGLTKSQSLALHFIRSHLDRNEYGPSYEEIANGIGLASKSSVSRLVKGLEKRGFIRRLPNRPRSIEVVEYRGAAHHLMAILSKLDEAGWLYPGDDVILDARTFLFGEGR